MRQQVGLVISVAVSLGLALGCQKNGETEMRPASGVNPDYERSSQEPREPVAPQPTPGSGTGIPGTQTTPGADEPGTGTGAGLGPSGRRSADEETRAFPAEGAESPSDPSSGAVPLGGGGTGGQPGGGGAAGRGR